MSSLRLIVPHIRKNLLKNRSIVSNSVLPRRAYHYADTGANYRLSIPPIPEDNIRWRGVRMMQIGVWFWVFYNLWYEPALVIGHLDFNPPDPSTFTDEELGLPPEGEDDELFQ